MFARRNALPFNLRRSPFPSTPNYRWNPNSHRPSIWLRRFSQGRPSQDPHYFSSFFTHTPIARFSLGRTLLWSLPFAGGVALYFAPQPQNWLHSIFSSPRVIPCPPKPKPKLQPVILSPSEPDKTLVSRIVRFLRERIWEPLLTARRFIHLLALFLPVMISAPMLLIGSPEARYGGERWGAVWWYEFLVRQMERAGPTFIKLAQWAASRADLFPAILCQKLGKLHSRGKPHSLHHTKRIIEKVFQRPFHEVFEEFDEEPIGCGAIAQVYKATLKQDLLPPSYLGPRRSKFLPSSIPLPQIPLPPQLESPTRVPTAAVAIKVLHPRVYAMISRDLRIVSFFAHMITLIPGMQWISLPEEVEVFGRMMGEQLDLRHEAENLERFEANFKDRKERITFPRPMSIWSSQEVLVEEYQNALPLEAFLKNGGGPFDHQLAELGLDAFLNMLLLDNFVHSDLHPGNIMITFCKPPLREIQDNFLRSVFTFGNKEIQSPTPKSPHRDSDEIVDRLRSLAHDREAWEHELWTLSKEGYAPEVVFIDAGLVTQLDTRNRQNFLDLFRAVAEFDGYTTGKLMVERCRSPELAIDTETFALKMQHIVLSVKRKTFSLGSIKISDILTEVLKAVRTHHVKMEGDFINTVISILLLEGIGRQLDPNLDLFKSALPILRQLGRQMRAQEILPGGNQGHLLKLWVYMEAREMASAAYVAVDEMVRYDWLTPGI